MGDVIAYLSACVLMGVGIGIDVALATFSLFSCFGRNKRLGFDWTAKISFTHILFPMLGYYGLIVLIDFFTAFTAVLGSLAAGGVAYFLWQILITWIEPVGADGISDDGLNLSNMDLKAVPISVVIAVSIDALMSGPAKSAQAVGWNDWEVLFSFPISGVVVGGIALISLYGAQRLYHVVHAGGLSPKSRIPLWETIGQYFEFSILSYFGWLALARYVFDLNFLDITIFGFSLAVTGAIFLFFGEQVYDRTKYLFELRVKEGS